MKFTTTLLAASAAAFALTTGTEARLGGSGRHLSIYGGSKTAYSYGGTNYNRNGYKANPSRSSMDAARRAGALTNREATRMGYSSNYRDDDDDDLGSIYGGSKTAYSYGGTNYNRNGYKANPSRSSMDAARRAGALTNREATRMGYSSNYRDDDDDDLGFRRRPKFCVNCPARSGGGFTAGAGY